MKEAGSKSAEGFTRDGESESSGRTGLAHMVGTDARWHGPA